MRSRAILVAIVGLLWAGGIAARLGQLQVVHFEHYREKARRQQQLVVELDPPRGTVYDARGRELAVSLEVDSAWADPSEIRDPQATAAALAPVVGIDAATLAGRLVSKKNFVWVARKLDPPVAEKVRRLGLPGIHFLPESKRYYPMGELAAQVLGYVGTDNQGFGGLELAYDREVAGRAGRRTLLRDARRGLVVAPGLAWADPEPGADLHLTLDATIQHIVERELARAVIENRAKDGSMVLLDPATGAVLAMASYPSFDPNRYGRYPPARWRNRVIMDAYEPGSTFKVVTAAAALESGLVHPEDRFDCEMGGITLAGIRIRDHKPFGILTFAEVLAKSSNVGMIKTSLKLGDQRLHGTIRGLGFGRPTGIDLPGENGGIVPPLTSWSRWPLTKCYASFGQGVSVTPIQLAAALGAVANGGRLLTPYVVAGVGRPGERGRRPAGASGHGGHDGQGGSNLVASPISAATAAQLSTLLEGVVTAGTGRRAAVPGYRVAGKTGTAQKPGVGGYAGNGYVPSFMGFAPAGRPVLVGVVAIDDPPGEHHGGTVAAPVFGAVARQVLLYLGVRPEREPPGTWPGQRKLPVPEMPEPQVPQIAPFVLASQGAQGTPSRAIGAAAGDLDDLNDLDDGDLASRDIAPAAPVPARASAAPAPGAPAASGGALTSPAPAAPAAPAAASAGSSVSSEAARPRGGARAPR